MFLDSSQLEIWIFIYSIEAICWIMLVKSKGSWIRDYNSANNIKVGIG
jgi:hypothetical protein